MRTIIFAGSSLLALCTPAYAQTAVPAAPEASSPAASNDAAEIIVTASKREERLQDIPVAVTVIGAAQLSEQNIANASDLTRAAPSLNISGFQNALSIRGIGGQTFSRSSESSVGVVVDGIALGNTSQSPPPLFDATRVEVLNGPQGTLFGRNSSAGVLNIVTNAPDPTKYEVIGHADIGSRDNYIGRAVINIPVAANAALRVSGIFSQAPNTVYNRFDESELRSQTYGGGARFKWTPTDRITINLIGDYGANLQKSGASWAPYITSPGSFLSRRLAACGVTVGATNQQACIDGGNYAKNQSYGISGQADMDFGGITLSSISAYRASIQRTTLADADSVAVNRLNLNGATQDIRNISQEFRLTSAPGSRIEYTLGLYYFDSASDGTATQIGTLFADYTALGVCPVFTGAPLALCGLPFGQVRQFHIQSESYAAYGQSTIHLTDRFRAILGARVGHESVHSYSPAAVAPNAFAAFSSTATVAATATDGYFSYRGGLQYDFTPHVMAYATYTRGYKGPSINDATPIPNYPAVVRPEIPHDTEIGLKITLFGGRLAANLAGYRNIVTDFQTQFYDQTAAAFVYGNAPRLKSQGVSLDLFGNPFKGLTLSGGVLYNDAKYGAGYNVACYQAQTAAQGCSGGVTSAAGKRLTGAPEWKMTGSVQYAVALSGRLEGFVGADVVYTSRVEFSSAGDPATSVAPAAIVSPRIGIRTDDKRYGVSVFARNVFDTYRPAYVFASPVAAQQLDFHAYSATPGADSRRVIGVSLDARF